MAPAPGLLAGRCRVLELGAAVAAPFCTALLADAGAEVIKIETERRPDNLRGNWPMHEGIAGRDRSLYYHIMNRNKRGLTLDLTHAQGREIFLDLVRISDVVVENFAAGTMERMGVPYDVLRRVNPGIVMVSSSGFGATGPARDHIAYGPLLEGVAGFASLNGYAGGPPTQSAFVYTDYLSAMYGVNLVLAALLDRMQTGRGAYFDLAQVEVALNAVPEAVLATAVNGVTPGKLENRDDFVPVHGVYPCRDEDKWIALAARTEEEWQGLCRALGRPAWTRERDFAGPVQRAAHRGELDRGIAKWTRRRSPQQAAAALQREGVAAMPVYNIEEVMGDSHIQARGAFQENPHPVIGPRPAYASPINIEGVARAIRQGAPLWGQDNAYVCQELLGLASEVADGLAETGAVR
ncbi:MAG: CoA transferase [Dehalococcoidia bacterium]